MCGVTESSRPGAALLGVSIERGISRASEPILQVPSAMVTRARCTPTRGRLPPTATGPSGGRRTLPVVVTPRRAVHSEVHTRGCAPPPQGWNAVRRPPGPATRVAARLGACPPEARSPGPPHSNAPTCSRRRWRPRSPHSAPRTSRRSTPPSPTRPSSARPTAVTSRSRRTASSSPGDGPASRPTRRSWSSRPSAPTSTTPSGDTSTSARSPSRRWTRRSPGRAWSTAGSPRSGSRPTGPCSSTRPSRQPVRSSSGPASAAPSSSSTASALLALPNAVELPLVRRD